MAKRKSLFSRLREAVDRGRSAARSAIDTAREIRDAARTAAEKRRAERTARELEKAREELEAARRAAADLRAETERARKKEAKRAKKAKRKRKKAAKKAKRTARKAPKPRERVAPPKPAPRAPAKDTERKFDMLSPDVVGTVGDFLHKHYEIVDPDNVSEGEIRWFGFALAPVGDGEFKIVGETARQLSREAAEIEVRNMAQHYGEATAITMVPTVYVGPR